MWWPGLFSFISLLVVLSGLFIELCGKIPEDQLWTKQR